MEILEVRGQFEKNLESSLNAVAIISGVDENVLKQSFIINELLSDLADTHEGYFTDEELDAFIAFFTSPLGASLLQKLSSFTESADSAAFALVEKKLDDFFEALNNSPTDPGNSGNLGPN